MLQRGRNVGHPPVTLRSVLGTLVRGTSKIKRAVSGIPQKARQIKQDAKGLLMAYNLHCENGYKDADEYEFLNDEASSGSADRAQD